MSVFVLSTSLTNTDYRKTGKCANRYTSMIEAARKPPDMRPTRATISQTCHPTKKISLHFTPSNPQPPTTSKHPQQASSTPQQSTKPPPTQHRYAPKPHPPPPPKATKPAPPPCDSAPDSPATQPPTPDPRTNRSKSTSTQHSSDHCTAALGT